MSRDHFWRSISRDTNVEVSALSPSKLNAVSWTNETSPLTFEFTPSQLLTFGPSHAPETRKLHNGKLLFISFNWIANNWDLQWNHLDADCINFCLCFYCIPPWRTLDASRSILGHRTSWNFSADLFWPLHTWTEFDFKTNSDTNESSYFYFSPPQDKQNCAWVTNLTFESSWLCYVLTSRAPKCLLFLSPTFGLSYMANYKTEITHVLQSRSAKIVLSTGMLPTLPLTWHFLI